MAVERGLVVGIDFVGGRQPATGVIRVFIAILTSGEHEMLVVGFVASAGYMSRPWLRCNRRSGGVSASEGCATRAGVYASNVAVVELPETIRIEEPEYVPVAPVKQDAAVKQDAVTPSQPWPRHVPMKRRERTNRKAHGP